MTRRAGIKGLRVLEPPTTGIGHEPARPIDALLAGYAAGRLEPHLHALIESHLILSPENRDVVRAMEAEAGDELEAIEPRPLATAARDAVLGAIYADGWYGRPRPRKADPDLPEPLDRLVGQRLDDCPWRRIAPGVAEHVIFAEDGLTASLLRMQPGRKSPRHTHDGRETTLVLKGGFTDQIGHFRRGDVAIADGTIDHQPVADAGEPCVCFAVTEGRLRLTGPFGRLVQRIVGR